MGWVGDYYWTHGPIVLAPDSLRRAWREELSVSEARKLAGARKALSVQKTKSGPAIVLPGGKHTTWLPIDSRCGFLVRQDKYLHPRYVEELFEELDPSWFEGPWRKVTTISIDEPLHLFDAVAGGLAEHGDDEEGQSRCDEYFVLELDPGRYVVQRSRATVVVQSREAEVVIFRLVREGHTMPKLSPVPKPMKPPPLPIARETVELASSLEFVATDGGPFVLIHADDLGRWYGVLDENGEFLDDDQDADYWRACVNEHVAVVEGCRGIQVLSIQGPISHAFHRTHDGGLFIGWQGADTAAGCLGAVLAQSEDAWAYRDFTWRVRGPAILMDANRDGRQLDRDRWPVVDLEPGEYLVGVLFGDSTHELDGEVQHPDGRIEKLMVSALRLRGPMKD